MIDRWRYALIAEEVNALVLVAHTTGMMLPIPALDSAVAAMAQAQQFGDAGALEDAEDHYAAAEREVIARRHATSDRHRQLRERLCAVRAALWMRGLSFCAVNEAIAHFKAGNPDAAEHCCMAAEREVSEHRQRMQP